LLFVRFSNVSSTDPSQMLVFSFSPRRYSQGFTLPKPNLHFSRCKFGLKFTTPGRRSTQRKWLSTVDYRSAFGRPLVYKFFSHNLIIRPLTDIEESPIKFYDNFLPKALGGFNVSKGSAYSIGKTAFRFLNIYHTTVPRGYCYPFEFKSVHNYFRRYKKFLFLNFRRFRFFPSIRSSSGELYATLSLGLFSKFTGSNGPNIKSKSSYLLVASFIRKLLIYGSLDQLVLVVARTPMYLQEVLNTINNPVVALYKHPFINNLVVDELKTSNDFFFHMFIFLFSRPYGYLKGRKKGRIKRKITRRIVKLNQLVD